MRFDKKYQNPKDSISIAVGETYGKTKNQLSIINHHL